MYRIKGVDGRLSKVYSRDRIEKAFRAGKLPNGCVILSDHGEVSPANLFSETDPKPEQAASQLPAAIPGAKVKAKPSQTQRINVVRSSGNVYFKAVVFWGGLAIIGCLILALFYDSGENEYRRACVVYFRESSLATSKHTLNVMGFEADFEQAQRKLKQERELLRITRIGERRTFSESARLGDHLEDLEYEHSVLTLQAKMLQRTVDSEKTRDAAIAASRKVLSKTQSLLGLSDAVALRVRESVKAQLREKIEETSRNTDSFDL